MVSPNGGLAAVTTDGSYTMRNDEMIHELSDVELAEVSGGYYCLDSAGWRTSCPYGSFDMADDIGGAMRGAVFMATGTMP